MPLATAFAQSVAVSGRVVDAELAEPLSGVSVELVTAGGRLVAAATTDDDGGFRLVGAPEGTYSLLVSSIGYETYRRDRIGVGDQAVALGTIPLTSQAVRLNPVVVTASREQEKALESPASVYTVSTEQIEERPAATTVEHVRGLPGVDVATTGLQQNNVVSRGFNNVFSGALFVLTDNRWASVPSLRFNAYNLIPTTSDDIERIEFVLGPGSALYGPNVDQGVMHIITRSPLDHQGSKVSVMGGAREGNSFGGGKPVWQGSFRHAGLFSDDVGYKISAMYFRGTDWKYVDPVELEARNAAVLAGADEDTLLIGQRDYAAERLTADARVDWRINDNATLIVNGGLTSLLNSLEMTGIGTAQAKNWTYSYLQTRFRSGELFAQAYFNRSDAGDSYTLRDANQVVDKSFLFATQLQHATDVGERQRFVYGADFIRTVPQTEETIHGRNEDNDNITEAGGYVQSETELSPKFDLILAGRLDWHSVVENLVFSPRAALVFKPTEEHSFRVTYNRAFSQPTSINLNLDLPSVPTLGPFVDYGVRAIGVPTSGFTFRRDCGGLCMRSPFAADPAAFESLDVAPYWQNAIDGLVTILAAQGADPLNPQLEGFLRTLDPSAAGVGTVLKKFDAETRAFGSILTADQAAIDVAAMTPSITNTIEVGYKGLISDRLLFGADVYYQRVEDFVGPLRIETANAFLNPGDLGTFLQGPLGAVGLQPEQIAGIVGALANVPLGTITPEQVPTDHPTDLYVTYRNFGNVDLFGVDIGLTYLLTDEITVSGSYSLACGWPDEVDPDCGNFFPNLDNIGDIALNAPRNKATLSGQYRNPRIGLGLELRGRYVDSYPITSGEFVGDVPSYEVFDARISYKLPLATAPEVTLAATNIFDNQHIEMVGAPALGRMIMFRLTQSF